MGAIQGAVNQAIGAGAIMAGLYANSPAAQTRKQIKATEGNIANIEKQGNVVIEANEAGKLSNEATAEAMVDTLAKAAEEKKKLFELNPTEENLKEHQGVKDTLEMWDFLEKHYKGQTPSPAVAAQDEAMSHLDDSIAEKSLIEQFKAEPDKSKFLREAQKIQAQEKRGGKK